MRTDERNSSSRIVLRKFLGLFIFLAVCGVVDQPVFAGDLTVFGARDFSIGWFQVHFSFHMFRVNDPGEGIIAITKNTPEKNIRGGFLRLNGRYISLGDFYRSGESILEKSVNLRSRNSFFLFLRGDRAASVRVEVKKKTSTPPPQVSFSADPLSIKRDESSTLTWSTTNAASVTIEPDIGSVDASGTLLVSPTETTTYTITAEGPGGTATDSVTVTMTSPAAPTVSISASPKSIFCGESATLSWSSTNADSATMDQTIGRVDLIGSTTVTPERSTTYTITVSGPGGSSSGQAVVMVTADVEPQPDGSYGEQYGDLIPPDASLESYDSRRFSLITGLVHDLEDIPIADVSVSIFDHLAYGTVLTDIDGRFSIPVEGGATLTAVYQKEGLITAHRKVTVPWNDIAVAESVQMIPEDPASTALTFDGNPNTVVAHQSTKVTDEFGSRSCTMVFTGDNRAYEVDAQGNVVRELTTITTRATEFTAPESMPAVLPPTSAYTYCAEQKIDGVERVRFDKPIITWIDNFLGFDVGLIIPIGYYDREQAVWVAEDNGMVVRLLDRDSDGIVDALDADGDSSADDLDGDGDFSDEVEGLSNPQRYPRGATFWRATVNHFTPRDWNLPADLPPGAIDPNPPTGAVCDQQQNEKKSCPSTNISSFVEERSRIFHEDISIPGTDMTLHYASNRVEGYQYGITVPASGDTVPANLKKIIARVEVAGRILEQTLDPLPNQQAMFIWDGHDHLGRIVTSPTTATISIGFVYDAVYYIPSNVARSFGLPGTGPTAIPARQEMISWKRSEIVIHREVTAARGVIAEGWTLSSHHHLTDPSTLHKGDGSITRNSALIIDTVTGHGEGFSGDGGPAIEAMFSDPIGIAVDGAGNLYIADQTNSRIRKVDPNGIITTVAGRDYSQAGLGDGGPATEAWLGYPRGVAVDSAGNLYIADGGARVRKVDTNGIITTVAGNGVVGFSGDGGPATAASLRAPYDVAVDVEGNLYIADYNNGRIRKVDTNGIIITVAGGADPPDGLGDGGPATQARVNHPTNVAVDVSGNLYIVDSFGRVRKVGANGIITTVAGGGSHQGAGDGLPATQVETHAYAVAVDSQGNLYLGEYPNPRIRKVDQYGIISTVAGDGTLGFTEDIGDGGPAKAAKLKFPFGLDVDAAGNIYVTDLDANPFGPWDHRIRKIAPPSAFGAYADAGDIPFTEADGLGHILSSAGRHKTTIDLDTGVVLYAFGYDQDNHLISITDRFGNQTTIQRDGSGVPTAINSPDGLTTNLTIEANNHLTQITYPDGTYYGFEYTPDGLLTAKIEPEGNRFGHIFDALGRLTNATDEEGGNWQYSRRALANGDIRTEVLTTEGNLTAYVDQTETTGAYASYITNPTGAQTVFNQSSDGLLVSKSLPCGMDLDFKYGVDSQYKFQYVQEMTEGTPSGLERVTRRDKNYQDTDSDGVPDLITETVAVNGKVTTLEKNVLQAKKTITSPQGRTVTTSYDPATLMTTSLIIPSLNQTTYGYDSRGRLTSISAGTRETTFAYDALGNLASITDSQNLTTSYTYDAVGGMTGISRPDGSFVGFAYDKNGNMTVLANPAGILHGFGYNGVNLNNSYDTPLSGSYSYVYDRDRRLAQVYFPSGKQIKNIYANGRLEQIQTPEGNVDLTYVCGNKVDNVAKGTEAITYGYDGSLVTSERLGGTLNESLTYGYSSDFSLTSFTYSGGTVNYTYDIDGLLISAGSFSIARNAGNGLPEAVTGSGLNLSRHFNGYGEVENQDLTVGGQGVNSWSLTRDNGGRIAAKTETVGGSTANYAYTYDPMGRLLTVTKEGSLVEEYQYDNVGTRIYEMNALRNITGRSLSYDDEDHLLIAGDAAYQYDADGYLTKKTVETEETIYSYSSRSELLSVTLPDGKHIEYVHGPTGRRLAKKMNGTITEKYLWQGLIRMLAVYDESDNLIMRFLYADGRMPVALEKGISTYYLTYDQVGSLRVVVDSSGNVVKRIDYDSFGNIINDTNTSFEIPFGFAGGLHDKDTGLVRFGFRDYDPDVGRWTAKDPIGFLGGDVDLYGYCLNDPVKFVDRHGLLVEADPYTAADLSIPPGTSVSVGTTLGPVDLDYNPVSGKTAVYVTTPQIGGSVRLNFDFVEMGVFDPPDPKLPYVTIGTKNLGITYRADFSSITFALGFAEGAPINAAIPLGEVQMHGPIGELSRSSPCP